MRVSYSVPPYPFLAWEEAPKALAAGYAQPHVRHPVSPASTALLPLLRLATAARIAQQSAHLAAA